MRFHVSLILLLLFVAGCAHDRHAPDRGPALPGAPDVAAVLADLAAQGEGLETLESIAMIRLRLPGQAATQNFRTAFIQYEAPDRFFVQGRKPGFLVRVYVEGERFLLELPSENVFYYGRKGDQFPEDALDVAPSQVFRELFFLNVPGPEALARTEMLSYDTATRTVTLAVAAPGRTHRIERQIRAVKDGVWRVEAVTLFDAAGLPVAETVCHERADFDGRRIPTNVNARFPGRDGAEMAYDLRVSTTKINDPGLRPVNSLAEARESLAAEGYREIRGESQ